MADWWTESCGQSFPDDDGGPHILVSMDNIAPNIYREISNKSCTKSHNLNDSRLVLQLSLPDSLKAGVKSRMKM